MKYFYLIVFLLLSGCHHKKNKDFYLVKWDKGMINISDLNLREINSSSFKNGKDKFRILLAKKFFKNIFKEIGIKYNVLKSSKFIDEWANKKTVIKTDHYKKNLIKNSLLALVPTNSNKSQADLIEATKLYDIYIYLVKCSNESKCSSNLNKELIDHSFKSLSKSKQDNISGYYLKIPKYNLLKSIQKNLISLKHNQISKPIQIADQTYIFVMVENSVPSSPYLIKKHEKLLKKRLQNKKSQSILNFEKESILNSYPQLAGKSDDEIFAFQANQLDFSNDKDLQIKLSNAYDWIVANHGFNIHYSKNISINEIRNILKQEINFNYIFTRFNLQIIELDHNIDSLSSNEKINILLDSNTINEKKYLNQITQIDFNKSYTNTGINLIEIENDKWIGPIKFNKNVLWLRKTYDGLAINDQILLEDYLIYKRNYIASVNNLMKEIGNNINLKFNPIIYSDQWPELVKEFLDELNL